MSTKNPSTSSVSRQAKRSCPGSSDSDTDDSPLNFPRWLIIEAAEPAHSLLKLSPFVLGKALTAQIGSLKSVKRLYKGDILVETDKATYSKMLLGLTQLAGVPVKSQPPQITERQPRSDPLEGHCRLQRQGNCRGATPTGSDRCRDHQMETANVAQTRWYWRLLLLSFRNTSRLVIWGSLWTLIFRILYAVSTVRYGHSSRACKNPAACVKCGKAGHEGASCSNQEQKWGGKCPLCLPPGSAATG